MNRWASTLLLSVLLLAVPSLVKAHDWYPWECCNVQDCAPVIKAESEIAYMIPNSSTLAPVEPLPSLRVTTKHGTVLVPPDFKWRESKDAQMHVCIRNGRLLCGFLPPGQ